MDYPKTREDAEKRIYKFWDTQPVPKLNEIITIDSKIEETINQNDVPLSLLENFEWCVLNLNDDNDLTTMTMFLDKFYVEDNKNEFRLHYTNDLLSWMYKDSTNIALCVKTNNVLVATICGKVIKTQVNKNKIDMIEVNLLCVHPKLRNKRLAPVLIQELNRRFSLLGYSTGIYTASTYLPTPILTAKYYHKILNAEVLYDTGFVRADKNTSLKNIKKAHKLPSTTQPFFKKMQLSHIDQMYNLFNTYMEKYNLHPLYTKEEFATLFTNKLVTCYVLENDNSEVIDFVSYYTMESRVLKNNEKHKFIKKAYLYYYTSLNETSYNLIKNLLIVARNHNMDVFTAMDIMENHSTLQDLGFDQGTGSSHYYLYNWKIKPLKNIQCSMILR